MALSPTRKTPSRNKTIELGPKGEMSEEATQSVERLNFHAAIHHAQSKGSSPVPSDYKRLGETRANIKSKLDSYLSVRGDKERVLASPTI